MRISLLTPRKGKVGTRVQIIGMGFSATPALNSVAFNGTSATVTEASPNRLVTSVPSGATTGPVTVTAPLGTATSTIVFHVLGDLAVTPSTARLFVNRPLQFEAREDGTPTTVVRWAVNGFAGGNSTVGTITGDGLYVAPTAPPNPATVTVTAAHRDDPKVTASGTVTILPPLFLATSVSVWISDLRTVDRNVNATVSVIAAPPGLVNNNVTAAASVRVADGGVVSNGVMAAASVALAPTSTRFVGSTSVSAAVAASRESLATSAPTSVSVSPVVAAVAPASGARGATLTLTLSGSGFSGATGVVFLRNNAADTAITVGNLVVGGDGAQVTVDITIGAGAAVGDHVVQVMTPAGSSSAAGTGGDLFTVQ